MRPERNPYVGPRPFELDEAELFFGRTREIRDVASLVVAHRIVLLYSGSGAGKSSLINAGVTPALAKRGFQVLPPARVSAAPDTAGVENVFAASVVAAWAGQEQAPHVSLTEFLRRLPRDVDEDGQPVRRLAVVDQFEELFTAHPERWSERTGLFDQLRAALEADERLRLLLALREEFLAQLEPFAPLVPDALRTRFRLERLDHAGALAAVTGPVASAGRHFAADAAEELVTNLRTLQPGVVGEYVEPVHLQVVCSELWTRLRPDVDEIDSRALREFADLDTVLGRFYDNALASAAHAGWGVGERQLRAWVRDKLITSGGTRGTVYRGDETTQGLPNVAVDALERERLIRAEERARARWYELTHDRLIEPIRASNARYFAARQERNRRWVATGVLAAIVAIGGAGAVVMSFQGSAPTSDFVAATLAPRHLDFGARSDPADLQAIRAALTFSSGSDVQRIVEISTTGGADDFTPEKACLKTIERGHSCSIRVHFDPTQLGRRDARLVVRTSERRFEAGLSGTLTGHCGVQRWPVKTLSDADAQNVDLDPRPATVAALTRLAAPRNPSGPRVRPVEFNTYRVRARLLAMRLEQDSDIKLVLADPKTGATMAAELPAAACTLAASRSLRDQMRQARRTVTGACGQPSGNGGFTALRGTATITGVGFFDRRHHAQGEARNGIELHPVLAFESECGTPQLTVTQPTRTFTIG